MYVIEFPFNKIVRLYSTAYYRLKNLLQILVWGCGLFKGVLKILENVQVLYQESIHAVLLMSVLWKMTEFYKGESDRSCSWGSGGGCCEPPPAGRFSHYGALPSHQIFSPPHESLSSPYCYLKWDSEVNKK